MRLLPAIVLSLLPLLACAAPGYTTEVEHGPHAVGLRVLQQYDQTRVYKPGHDTITGEPTRGERARPVQTLLWYPAQAGGKAVSYLDYVRAAQTEDDYTLSVQQVEQKLQQWLRQRGAYQRQPEAFMQELRTPTWAARDAAAAPGRYPVVIYAPSFSASAHENVELCEFLASHGYIVLSSADMGARTRSMSDDLEGIETQAADIRFLIGSASTLAQADTGRIGVIGFSWGGISNVFAAARDDRIRALVSLDGSIRYYPEFVDGGVKAAKYVTPARVAVPFMYIAARPKSIEQLNSSDTATGYSFINKMQFADVYLLSMRPMTHGDFSSYGLRLSPADAQAEYSRAEVVTAHNWSMRYVQQFLQAYLKDDRQALAFLQKPATENGTPRHMMTIEQRKGKLVPPSFERLALELRANGYAQAPAVYQRMQQSDAGFSISEPEMNAWGYSLQRAGYVKDAIEVLKLALRQYPASANLYDSLGEMYEIDGQKAEAIASYRHALELDAGNANAVQHLKVLAQ